MSTPAEIWTALGYEVEEHGDLCRVTMRGDHTPPAELEIVLKVRPVGVDYSSGGEATVVVEVLKPRRNHPAYARGFGYLLEDDNLTQLELPFSQVKLAPKETP